MVRKITGKYRKKEESGEFQGADSSKKTFKPIKSSLQSGGRASNHLKKTKGE